MLQIATGEQLIPVYDLAEQVIGNRPSPATVWRWRHKGTAAQGRLPVVEIGGCTRTTRAAFVEWLQGAYAPVTTVPADDLPDASDDALRAAGLL